jgi:hypothetical protein
VFADDAVDEGFNPLAHADEAFVDPPRTVGDMLAMCTRGQLSDFRGLGSRRISEIGAAWCPPGWTSPPTRRRHLPGVVDRAAGCRVLTKGGRHG